MQRKKEDGTDPPADNVTARQKSLSLETMKTKNIFMSHGRAITGFIPTAKTCSCVFMTLIDLRTFRATSYKEKKKKRIGPLAQSASESSPDLFPNKC